MARKHVMLFVLSVAILFAGACAFGWVSAFVQISDRGLDVSDEGNYLLSYRWWSVNHRTYTGSQYLYGPVFQLLDWNIAKLRLFRLVTILVAHAAFGLALMTWLRPRRPNAPKTPLWEACGTLAIVAASGMATAWTPLSPGYNDVALLGAVGAAAFALRVATLAERNERIPRWLPLAFGPVLVALVLAKWSSAIAIFGPIILITALTLLSARGLRSGLKEIADIAAWMLASSVATLVLINIFIVRLDKVVPEFIEVNRILVRKGNPPLMLLQMYWNTSLNQLRTTFDRYSFVLAASALASVGRTRVGQILSAALFAWALREAALRTDAGGGFIGGTYNLVNYSISVLGVFVASLVIAMMTLITGTQRGPQASAICHETLRGWLMVGLLLSLPILHGLGTGNHLYVMVVNGFAGWMAVMILIATGIERGPLVGRLGGYAIVASGLLTCALITRTGLLEHPYRTAGLKQSPAHATGVPALASLRLSPTVADRFSSLHKLLEPYTTPPGRAMMAFDEISGVILALDGRYVGESWAASGDWERTSDGLRASCRDGHPWWESRWPIFIFTRRVSDVERRALAACRIDFDREYLLLPGSQDLGYSVYVPAREVRGEVTPR